jgi:S-adenosylmethionine:tRNA ribosyltransferase-isomerase
MTYIPRIAIKDYDYLLPEENIAKYPVYPKHHSKLLVYNRGTIQHNRFISLPDYLEKGEVLLVNNTQVIPARLWFQTEGGVWIQIFLLKPLSPDWSVWKVMVGNRRKFKEGMNLHISQENEFLRVTWHNRDRDEIRFVSSSKSIPEWIERLGEIPLPPYLNRDTEESDIADYQAIFAKNKGAVAAPTASLHFTSELLEKLEQKGIQTVEATLHVGAGTFKPVDVEFVDEHEMHAEQFQISLELIEELMRRRQGILAVGTTACRVLESIPILGAKLILGELQDVFVSSEDAYRPEIGAISTGEALNALYQYVFNSGGIVQGETQIFMIPGFEFRLTSSLITNFHQPKSTLMLLIAAFVGEEWKRIYEEALGHSYRFLSYGDGSLLHGKKNISW